MSGEPKRVKPWPPPPTVKSPEQVRLETGLASFSAVLDAANDTLASHRADPALCSHASYLLRAFRRSLVSAVSS